MLYMSIPSRCISIIHVSISVGCTIQFKYHGSSLREDSSYWSSVGFATQGSCESECFVDDLCAAIVYDSEIGECRKSSSTASKNANNCPTCSFWHKQCGTGKCLLQIVQTPLLETLRAIRNRHSYSSLQ